MASATVSKCIKGFPRKEIMSSSEGRATKQMSETWKTIGEKQWGRRRVAESVQSLKIVGSKAKSDLITHKDEAMNEEGRGLEKDKGWKSLAKVCTNGDKKRNETKGLGLALSRIRKGVLDGEIVDKILAVLATIQSMAALELKVKFSKYSLSLHKVAGRIKLVQCRLVLDVPNHNIRLKIQNSSAVARLIPTPVQQAVTAMNLLINRLPLNTEDSVFRLFMTISEAAFTTQEMYRSDAVGAASHNVIDDVSKPVLSPGDAISDVCHASDFLSALKSLDIQILCSSVLKLELKKRKLFSKIGRKMVMIDAKEGLEIVKEPRVLFKRREFRDALGIVQAWVRSCSGFKVAQQVLYIAETIKDTRY